MNNLTTIKKFLRETAMFELRVEGVELQVSGIDTKWSHHIRYEFYARAELDISIEMHPQFTKGLYI